MLGSMDPTMMLVLMAILLASAIGLIIWTLRYAASGSKNKPRATKVEQKDTVAPDQQERVSPDPPAPRRDKEPAASVADAVVAARPSLAAASSKTREVVGMIPLMQVWQDADGVLVIEVGGQQYRRLFDVRDGDVGRLILDTIERLLVFSKGQAPPAASLSVQSLAASLAAPGGTDAVIAELRSSPEEPTVRKRLTFSLDPVPGRRRDPVRERMESGLRLNLAQEIDKILQVHVKAAPLYQDRYIHVVEAADGSLCFVVDDNRYSGVEQVPDLAVRQIIQTAVQEWEQKR